VRFRSLPSLVLLRAAPSTETLLRQAITQRLVPSEADNARGSIHLALIKEMETTARMPQVGATGSRCGRAK